MGRKVRFLFVLSLLFFFLLEPVFAQRENLWEIEALILKDAYAQAAAECRKIIAGQYSLARKSQAQYLLGVCLLQEGEFAQARDNFNEVLSRYSHGKYSDEAAIGIADSYFLAGDYTQAGIYYEKFLQDYPRSPLVSIARTQLEQSRLAKPFANSYFSVQVGCFSKKANAERLCEELSRAGFQAYIVTLPNEEDLLRVRVGRLSNRLKAELLEQELKVRGYPTRVCP